jgi:hypothetical protein
MEIIRVGLTQLGTALKNTVFSPNGNRRGNERLEN